MTQQEQQSLAAKIAENARKALDEKQGLDVTVLPVAEVTALADYFVLATATSSTQVKALADYTEYLISQDCGVKPLRSEGFGDNVWTLIDYGSVVVHIFTREGREFYKLEKLWKDVK